VAHIAKYLVGREKKHPVRSDTSWFDRAGRGEHLPTSASSVRATSATPLRIAAPTPDERYVNCVPLVPLHSAAGTFGDPQHIDEGESEWVAVEFERVAARLSVAIDPDHG
jgi:hypothetical protein